MLRKRLLLILLSPLLVLALGGFRSAPLVNPDPIAIPAGTSQAEVARVIKAALISRNWIISEDQPGTILATQNVRDHMARIGIDYDASHIRIKYVDSRNLHYGTKRGRLVIHKNYLSWINNLVVDISGKLQLGAL